MNGETLLQRIVKSVVSITLFAFFLIGAIVLITGCAEMEEEYVPPRIVSIDPPLQNFTPEEADVWLDEKIPYSFVHVNLNEYNSIAVTFSSPPQELDVRLGQWSATDYHLDGSTLHITTFCTSGWVGVLSDITTLYIKWRGGGQIIQLWCPTELFLADE